MTDDDQHEIYAIRYGHHKRKAAEKFILGDPPTSCSARFAPKERRTIIEST
jgi:hypothetical protein